MNNLIAIFISQSMCWIFIALSYCLIVFLNTFGLDLSTSFDVKLALLGMTIYLKTAVDYAIFVSRLMNNNLGLVPRIAMNAGTSLGAFIGVTMVFIIWAFFNQVPILMFIMLVIAGCILLELGEGSEEHYKELPEKIKKPVRLFFKILSPVYKKIIFFLPDFSTNDKKRTFWNLFFYSAIIPFILGIDDLAGYMSLMTPTNVFSFLCGIYIADSIIDAFLFMKPEITIKIIKNKWISFIGAIFFITLGLLSFYHAFLIFI